MTVDDPEAAAPDLPWEGHSYLYVLPCFSEDLLKVGFSRDPLKRFRSLHRRFFDVFDLDQAFLVQTDSLREARRLERIVIERWPEHRAPAPLTVAPRAGGHTEWFRGIGEPLRALAERLAERYGHQLHAPLKSWLRERLQAQAELLYGWSSSMHALLVANELHGVSDAHDRRCRAALVEAIDACDTVGLDLQAIFPAEVLAKVRP